ncbi:MAG: hypothetical protein ACI86X_002530 [Moritella sp.]|jgi:hypothetical protein
MKQVLLLIMLLTSCSAVSAIYQWTDENGITHFSDDESKPAQAKEVEIKLTPPSIGSLTKSRSTEPARDTSEQALPEPVEVSIAYPSDQQTLRSNSGEIKVSAALNPSLKYGFKIRLLIDDVIYSEQIDTLFQVTELPVGDHRLQLQIINHSGRIFAVSDIITVYLHRFKAK